MLFETSPTDPRHVIATDYWDSPEGKSGQPVLSFGADCFRLFLPVKASLGERYAQLAIVIRAIEACQFPQIVATTEGVAVIAGNVALKISWRNVHGITLADFPTGNYSTDFAAYTFYGKRGPKISFRRKATYTQVDQDHPPTGSR